MDDDFNSAGAIGQIFELVKTYHVLLDENGPAISNDRSSLELVKTTIEMFDSILGLFKDGLPEPQDSIPEEIKRLVDARSMGKSPDRHSLARSSHRRIERPSSHVGRNSRTYAPMSRSASRLSRSGCSGK